MKKKNNVMNIFLWLLVGLCAVIPVILFINKSNAGKRNPSNTPNHPTTSPDGTRDVKNANERRLPDGQNPTRYSGGNSSLRQLDEAIVRNSPNNESQTNSGGNTSGIRNSTDSNGRSARR